MFFQIRKLRAGDQVNVSLADGAIAHFRVSAVAMYAKDQFPAQQVYAPHAFLVEVELHPAARLIDLRTPGWRCARNRCHGPGWRACSRTRPGRGIARSLNVTPQSAHERFSKPTG